MSVALAQHQLEIQRNLRAWQRKPLLRKIYDGFYDRILQLTDRSLPGTIVEIGSGIGNLKARLPEAIATDLFPNPWLDVICDGYELPFASGSISHLILFDVFHHLRAPRAFLREAGRVLGPRGRVILFEPYISALSYPAYGLFHHEPVAWREAISEAEALPRPRDYYAAQGNATRLFFSGAGPPSPIRRSVESRETSVESPALVPRPSTLDSASGWAVFHREAFASLSYLFSGGFSRAALYPVALLPVVQKIDRWLSRWPRLFAARCLVGLRRE